MRHALLIFVILIAIGGLPSWAQVTDKIIQLESELRGEEDPIHRIDLILDIAEQYRSINIHSYPDLVDSALRLSTEVNYQAGLARGHFMRGIERWLNGYYQEAENAYHQSAFLATQLHDTVLLASVYSYLGLSFLYHASYDSALKYQLKSLSLHKVLNIKNKIAHNLDNLALIYHYKGQIPKVIEYTANALRIRSGIPGYSSRTNFYHYGGDAFNAKAAEEAIIYHKKVLAEERAAESPSIGSALNNIGSVYYTAKMYDSAVHYLKAGAEVVRQSGSKNYYAGHLNELGQALRENGQYPEAEQTFLTAKIIWDSVGTRHSIAIINDNLAKLYEQWGQYRTGLGYIDQAIRITESIGYNPFLAKSGYTKARLLLGWGDVEEALYWATLSTGRAEEVGEKNTILAGYDLLGTLFHETGDPGSSFHYMKKASELREEIYNDQSALQLAQMQVEYETQRKNQEIELLNAQNQAQKAEILQSQLIGFSAISGFLILAFALYKRWKYNRDLTRQNQYIEQQKFQLELKNRERGMLLGEIHHRVKNNLQLISSILKLQSRKLEDDGAREAIREGRNRVKAMALIHQQLYSNDQYACIEVHTYMKTLIRTIADSFGYNDEDYQLSYKVDPVKLEVDSAIQVGLISNELICNVFKHGFKKDRDNELSFALKSCDDTVSLMIRDNGNPDKASFGTKRGGFGMFLIENLVDDMGGQMTVNLKSGTEIEITVRTQNKPSIGSNGSGSQQPADMNAGS